jgi:hypothetical protein
MGLRTIAVMILAGILWLSSSVVTPAALALTQIKLTDLSYHDCTGELAEGVVSSGGGNVDSNCFIVTGKANNPSGKPLVDADVFGRIYDANGNPAMQNRGRVGTLPEVPPGVSDFEIRITVAEDLAQPLQLKQFKASGFTSQVRPFYYD